MRLMRHVSIALLIGFIGSISVLVHSAASQQAAPSAIGGFTLNSPISDYDLKQDQHYLQEVIITDIAGFRKGFITYGTCENPDKILRIKLKYYDRSYAFYEELLKRFKQKFGSKPQFSGDRFGNVKSWKWEFTNKDGHRVTLVLQHNLKDTDESIGNMVKLSLPDLMNAERLCFNKTATTDAGADSEPKEKEIDWETFIPR